MPELTTTPSPADIFRAKVSAAVEEFIASGGAPKPRIDPDKDRAATRLRQQHRLEAADDAPRTIRTRDDFGWEPGPDADALIAQDAREPRFEAGEPVL